MDEPNRNSMKLDIEAVQLSSALETPPKESYKLIPDTDHIIEGGKKTNGVEIVPAALNNMVREKNDIDVEDGSDETMLPISGIGDGDKEKLATPHEEVKFIQVNDQNGDAKIDIGAVKGFTGMTKDELMKYANDPFWIRLRWILFILFWGLWVAMLIGAILIILNANTCEAPKNKSWWQEGPLIKAELIDNRHEADNLFEESGATGIIYELPGDETYIVDTPEVEAKIKKLVQYYREKNVNVILDITPNYVTGSNELFKQALDDETHRSPFIWSNKPQLPNNWVSRDNKAAWKEIKPQNWVLSQYGDNRYDLQMNDTVAKEKFKDVLKRLITLGVMGFRLTYAQNLIVNPRLPDDIYSDVPQNGDLTNYRFWKHIHTTNQPGLSELLFDFQRTVHNYTNGNGFLTVTDNIESPEVFKLKNQTLFSIDLPKYGRLPLIFGDNKNQVKHLVDEFENIKRNIGNSTWLQWNLYDVKTLKHLETSEYLMFTFLLPGVPILSIDTINTLNQTSLISKLVAVRKSPSFMHGSFEWHTSNNGSIIAYSRIKSGNPGYFVVLNPTNEPVEANFEHAAGISNKLTVNILSDSYNYRDVVERSKINSNAIPISPHSAMILTYVPKSS